MELFQKVSPSVFVVEALDENGKTPMLGTAVAIARDVLITNCHVVENGSSLRVRRGKETWNGRLIQAVSTHDLCGLRPSGLTLQPVEVRPSSKLATGEHVYAIGSPEGLELTFSEGVISALRETDGIRLIQTSAPISPGSSGGGLFDSQGILVGVTTFFLKEGQSLNFALPGEWVTDVLARSRATAHSALSDATLESAAWIDIGLEAVKKEDYDLALHSFSKCVALKESDAYRAWFEIGKIWENPSFYVHQEAQTKALSVAASALERTIQLRPDYAEAWHELASTYGVEHKEQQALDAAKEAARLDPGNRLNWSTLGVMYFRVNSYKKAIDALQQALRTQPNDSSVPAISDASLLYMIGLVYSNEGDREHVLEIYTKLKAVDPKGAEDFFREHVLPQPWNARALTASYDGMEINENDHHILIFYVIENTTDQDYRVETKEDISLNAKLAQQQSLAPFDDSAKIQYPIFIPSKQRVRVGIEIQYPYSGKKEPSTKVLEELEEYVRTQFKNLDGFVLFDSKNRYQINFPKPNPPLSSR